MSIGYKAGHGETDLCNLGVGNGGAPGFLEKRLRLCDLSVLIPVMFACNGWVLTLSAGECCTSDGGSVSLT